MKPVFYTKIPIVYLIVLGILFAIITVITLGLGWRYFDFFICHKYWLNRRILLRYIKLQGKLSSNQLISKELIIKNIIEYKFEDFRVCYWTKTLSLTVKTETDDDLVGLFVGSSAEDKMVIKIIRQLTQLESNNKSE